jgi:hypothetical protein
MVYSRYNYSSAICFLSCPVLDQKQKEQHFEQMFALIKPPECQDGLIKVIVPDLSSKF